MRATDTVMSLQLLELRLFDLGVVAIVKAAGAGITLSG
jgi:hypothetical protein